jgi:DNA-binding GntR family transcriptional regulator
MPASAIDHRTLREQLADRLRDEIATGVLGAGDQLVEMALGAKFGVSRSTVREVLRELHEQGLVIHHPRTGTRVRALGPREILEIYEVRAALEGRAAGIVASSTDRDHAVSVLVERIRAMQDLAPAPFDTRVRRDLDFHREICRLAANKTLQLTWERLLSQIANIHLSVPESLIEPLMSPSDHILIVEAIAAGDADLASRTVSELMRHSALELTKALRSPGGRTTSFLTARSILDEKLPSHPPHLRTFLRTSDREEAR